MDMTPVRLVKPGRRTIDCTQRRALNPNKVGRGPKKLKQFHLFDTKTRCEMRLNFYGGGGLSLRHALSEVQFHNVDLNF